MTSAVDLQSRTVVRPLVFVNQADRDRLDLLCRLYGNMLSQFMVELQTHELRARAFNFRELRNSLVAGLADKSHGAERVEDLRRAGRPAQARLLALLIQNRDSTESHLQARHWKLALEEACQVTQTYWLTVSKAAQSRLYRYIGKLDAQQKHYVNWLLSGCHRQFFYLLDGHIPDPTVSGLQTMGLSQEEALRACRFNDQPRGMHGIALHVRSIIKRVRLRKVRPPRCTPSNNRVDFDCDCWQIVKSASSEHQTISLMSAATEKREPRILMQVKGHGVLRGTLQVMRDEVGNYRVNVFQSLRCKSERSTGKTIGCDAGYTELAATSEGDFYGQKAGEAMGKISDIRKDIGVKRNRMYAAVKNLRKSSRASDHRRAAHILKHNLGRKKLNERKRKEEAQLVCLVNEGLNQLLSSRDIRALAVEDLTHMTAGGLSKKWNRRLSAWIRGYIRERLEYKCHLLGIRLITVNCAYSSQRCTECGCVDRHNRDGDRFKCRHCGTEGHADTVASKNLLERVSDPEITLRTPRQMVKRVLEERFRRRLEMSSSAHTAPGRTS